MTTQEPTFVKGVIIIIYAKSTSNIQTHNHPEKRKKNYKEK